MRWSPDHYLKYADHRLRPALDLLARIPLDQAEQVVDLGCGPGNMVEALLEAFPTAKLTGIDNSEEMLARAREVFANQATWQHADVNSWTPKTSPDLIFSNAALQWLGDHASLFPRLFGFVPSGGVLAVQMPNQFAQPSHVLMREVARDGPWAEVLKPLLRPAPVANPEDYYGWLKPQAKSIDVWQTEYTHDLKGDDPVLDWISSTALNPLLGALLGDQREDFQSAVAQKLRSAYPKQADGTTLFAFKRLFVVAVKA
ncbi:MAG: trans-aconitate 2-methyltransferase [Rhodospirillaceae bacterium]|nr:MAG: trans-aconitate 2-methyltransferase [Rhodospirillaceae bacterium]